MKNKKLNVTLIYKNDLWFIGLLTVGRKMHTPAIWITVAIQ